MERIVFLYNTTNAGFSWNLFYTAVQSVYSIYFLDINTGWLGLNNNKIVYTTNGGMNWTNQTMPILNSNPISDIYFINGSTGYAGRSAEIYKTTNGGVNWGYQNVSTGCSRISILDSMREWAGLFGISHTINGGGPILDIQSVSNHVPQAFNLYQNFPNPFNPVTTFRIDIAKSSNIDLVICDLLGRELELVKEGYLKAGSYTYTWNASKYTSGVYFYRLITETFSETRKMILIK